MKSFLSPVVFAALPSLALSEIVLRQGLMLDSALVVQKDSGAKQHSAPTPDPAGSDLLLFENGDLMHGKFEGIDEGLLWNRNDIDRPIKWKTPGIRQVVFKGASGFVLEEETSFVTLVNGDSLPAKIVSLDDKFLFVESSIVGDMKIPRAHVKSLSPNPFDGELFYSGPYTSDGWMILENRKTKEQIEKEAEEAKKAAEAKEEAKAPEEDQADEKKTEKKDEKKKGPEKSSSWIHSGAAFYNLDSSPLIMPNPEIPDIGRIKFKAEWKGSLRLSIALLCDFTRVLPPVKDEEKEDKEDGEEPQDEEKDDAPEEAKGEDNPEDPPAPAPLRSEKLVDLIEGNGFQTIPWIDPTKRAAADIYGSGYTMTLSSSSSYSYPYLSRNYFSETGAAQSQRMSSIRGGNSLSPGGETEVEIRYNRKESLLVLFINGTYTAQWNDLAGFPGDGNGFGIVNSDTKSQVRISEVMITSWNGMTDSAKSMSHADRDLVLLANGTDRLSGQITHIKDGVAHLKSDYVNAEIPVSDLSKIVLKKSTAIDLEAEDLPDELNWKADPATVVYKPFGKIRINPISATEDKLTGTSPFLGEVTIDLSAATLLRFTEGSPDLSDWFDDF